MNLLVFLFLFGLIVSPSLAQAARVKYNVVTGEIVSMSNTKDNKVGTNEAIIDVINDPVPDINKYKVVNDVFRPKTAQELAQDQAAKDQEKADRKTRKKSVMTKIGLNKQDIKPLIELIEDGSDD